MVDKAVNKVLIREFNADTDIEVVGKLERNCELESKRGVSIFTNMMCDPLCRIRFYPLHIMLVGSLLWLLPSYLAFKRKQGNIFHESYLIIILVSPLISICMIYCFYNMEVIAPPRPYRCESLHCSNTNMFGNCQQVAQLLENEELVGVVRGCIKHVGTGFGGHVIGCILGLRVSPTHRYHPLFLLIEFYF